MKILTQALPEGEPREVHSEYDPKELDLEFVDLTYLEGVVLDGTVEKLRNTLTFRGSLKSRIAHTCARCLKDVPEPVNHPFEVVYDITEKQELDTLEDIREMLLLDHPIRFLCKEECAGLCAVCGVNLNEQSCSCPK